MIIREAVQKDRPAIVQLLKASLGESMIPKSEALWQWKHEDNPFGSSYVLLAEEQGELIGLRAFLQWQWQNNNGVYKAIRAVDTATHPDHQGKGLFKKLTLQLAEHCKAEGIHFVFNTPNEKSRPGYLKMGWVDQGAMPVSITPVNIFPAITRKLTHKKTYSDSLVAAADWSIIDQLPNVLSPIDQQLKTVVSTPYLRWRYGTNPLFPYNYITDHKTYLLIYRIKSQGPLREFRIADIFSFDPTPDFKHLNTHYKKILRAEKADIASISYPNLQHWKKAFGPLYFKTKGPLVTLKQLAAKDEFFREIQSSDAWNYSLGDMELF